MPRYGFPLILAWAFVMNILICSITEEEAKEVHKSLKIAAGIFKYLKVIEMSFLS